MSTEKTDNEKKCFMLNEMVKRKILEMYNISSKKSKENVKNEKPYEK